MKLVLCMTGLLLHALKMIVEYLYYTTQCLQLYCKAMEAHLLNLQKNNRLTAITDTSSYINNTCDSRIYESKVEKSQYYDRQL